MEKPPDSILSRYEGANKYAVLGGTVEATNVSSESTLIGKAVRNVFNVDSLWIRRQGFDSLPCVGDDPVTRRVRFITRVV